MEPESTETSVSSIAGHLLGTPSSPKDALITLDIELPAGVQIDSLEGDLADSNFKKFFCPHLWCVLQSLTLAPHLPWQAVPGSAGVIQTDERWFTLTRHA